MYRGFTPQLSIQGETLCQKHSKKVLGAEVGLIAEDHAVGTVTGVGVDTKDYDEALIVVNVGTVSATGTADIHLEESSVLGR